MSIDASTARFFEQLHLNSSSPGWIEKRLLSELPSLTTDIQWPGAPTGCLLADVGNYLLRLLHVLASFAENLLGGDLISDYLNARIHELAAEDDLSTANSIDDKHAALLDIASKLSQTLKDCESVWSITLSLPAPTVAFPQVRGSEDPFLQHQTPTASAAGHMANPSGPIHQTEYSLPARHMPQDEHGPGIFGNDSFILHSEREISENPAFGNDQLYQSSSASVGATDSGLTPGNTARSLSQMPLLGELKARGKGHYTCPHGHDCKKGGLQPNGELVIFERNSAFRAHLQLHERAFRCDLPGCTNQKGFARIDQLERHKTSVKHHYPGWVNDTPSQTE